MYFYVIIGVVLLMDQLTKWLIVSNMHVGESIPIIENFLYITSHRNTGAAWGMMEGQMWLFYVITIVFVGFAIWYVKKMGIADKLFGVGMALLLGGAIGNFIDRLFRQEVVDFVNTYPFGYDFPIFNVADAALTVGVAILLIHTFFCGK